MDELRLVKSGQEFFTQLVDIINRSEKKLHIQTYILSDDEAGQLISDALIGAVLRGVEVFVLVDAFGSHELSKRFIEKLTSKGIQFRKYSPLFVNRRLRFGRRLHHKVFLSDDSEALIGGINISDNYYKTGKLSPWLDYALYLKGPVCTNVSQICMKAWKGKLLRNSLKKRFHIKDYIKAKRPRSPVRIIQNDWINRKEAISLTLRSEIRNAKSSITIMASYFIPGARIRRLLRKAAARNVKIRMILPGISDVNIVRNATLWLYTWMARHNFEIYEWDKTILHGKIAAIDDKWVSIGSYNINHLSDYASVETNAELRETGICRQINDELHNVISHCQKISKDGVERKLTPLVQFKCWLSYYIARGLFFFEYAVMSKE